MSEQKPTTKGGLLYLDNKIVGLPMADRLARAYGFVYAEQLVKALENKEAIKLEVM
jgi:hypothetical protein